MVNSNAGSEEIQGSRVSGDGAGYSGVRANVVGSSVFIEEEKKDGEARNVFSSINLDNSQQRESLDECDYIEIGNWDDHKDQKLFFEEIIKIQLFSNPALRFISEDQDKEIYSSPNLKGHLEKLKEEIKQNDIKQIQEVPISILTL